MTCSVQSLPLRDPLSELSLLRALGTHHLLFDPFVAGKRRVDLHPLVLSRAMHEEAFDTAARACAAIDRVSERAFSDLDEHARYGIPPDALTLASSSYEAGDRTRMWRVDLLLGTDGHFRACEINADCPGGYNEASALGRLARMAGLRGVWDPTTATSALVERLCALAEDGAVALVHATAYAEDLEVCAILARGIEERGVRAILVSPTSLIPWHGDLWVGDDKIKVIYRFYPIEAMEGQANIGAIARAVRKRRVKSVSSFACVHAQSKISIARAHALGIRDADVFPFTCEVRGMDKNAFAEREAWVLKKGFGRVGEEVAVGSLSSAEDWNEAVQWARAESDGWEPWIAQRFVPQKEIDTPWGRRLVTLGVYVLDGVPVGYFGRLSPVSLATHDAMCVPVMVRDP